MKKGSKMTAFLLAMAVGTTGQIPNLSANIVQAAENIDFDAEPYHAVVMYWASGDPRDLEHVEKAFNELTLAELNIEVELQPITLGTYMQQIPMILASDDDLDIFPFYGSDLGTYIEMEYVVDLSDYLTEYGADIMEWVGEEDISTAFLSGYLGGIPTMHERTTPVGIVMRTDILNEIGHSADDIESAEDLTEIFAEVHERYPDMEVFGGSRTSCYPHVLSNSLVDPLGLRNFGVLEDCGQTTTVTNWYESNAFIEACKLMREWYQAGYISADTVTTTDSSEAVMKAGNLFSYVGAVKPDTKAEKDMQTGYDTTVVQLGGDLCTSSTTNGILYGISENSKDPEKAFMLLNWIYGNKAANDLLNWGVEGTDYVVTDEGTITYPEGITAENVGYHNGYGWALINQYNSYVWEGSEPGIFNEYQKKRDAATMSLAYGFYFNTSPVINELSALNSVFEEYIYALCFGTVDVDATIEKFNDALYTAGLQTVIDEKQSQLDAWLAKQ